MSAAPLLHSKRSLPALPRVSTPTTRCSLLLSLLCPALAPAWPAAPRTARTAHTAPRAPPQCSAVLTVRAEPPVRAEAHPLLMLRSAALRAHFSSATSAPAAPTPCSNSTLAPCSPTFSLQLCPPSPAACLRSRARLRLPLARASFLVVSSYAAVSRQHACPHCSKEYSKASNLKRHIVSDHPSSSTKKRVECSFCGCAFFDATKLQKHALMCEGAAALAGPASFVPAPSTARSSLKPRRHRCGRHRLFAWLQEPALPTEGMLRKVASQTTHIAVE